MQEVKDKSKGVHFDWKKMELSAAWETQEKTTIPMCQILKSTGAKVTSKVNPRKLTAKEGQSACKQSKASREGFLLTGS